MKDEKTSAMKLVINSSEVKPCCKPDTSDIVVNTNPSLDWVKENKDILNEVISEYKEVINNIHTIKSTNVVALSKSKFNTIDDINPLFVYAHDASKIQKIHDFIDEISKNIENKYLYSIGNLRHFELQKPYDKLYEYNAVVAEYLDTDFEYVTDERILSYSEYVYFLMYSIMMMSNYVSVFNMFGYGDALGIGTRIAYRKEIKAINELKKIFSEILSMDTPEQSDN